eukprot:scaffold285_cov330-Pavlova_lutheri.AAC.125
MHPLTKLLTFGPSQRCTAIHKLMESDTSSRRSSTRLEGMSLAEMALCSRSATSTADLILSKWSNQSL